MQPCTEELDPESPELERIALELAYQDRNKVRKFAKALKGDDYTEDLGRNILHGKKDDRITNLATMLKVWVKSVPRPQGRLHPARDNLIEELENSQQKKLAERYAYQQIHRFILAFTLYYIL